MLQNFRTYHVALQFYQECENLRLRSHLQDQLLRASLSVVLNLSEGSAQPTAPNRKRFYSIAFASFKESQSILDLSWNRALIEKFDHLGAMLYRLSRS